MAAYCVAWHRETHRHCRILHQRLVSAVQDTRETVIHLDQVLE
uniref:Uncharacterized protein n=1 Tax=Arundo donax TaxID=35708 RepID=A0A0A9CI05_ARUDO